MKSYSTVATQWWNWACFVNVAHVSRTHYISTQALVVAAMKTKLNIYAEFTCIFTTGYIIGLKKTYNSINELISHKKVVERIK